MPGEERSGDAVRVADVPERKRYEAYLGEELAGFAQYVTVGDRRMFFHTEVDPAFEGRGVGTALVRGALDDVRARGLAAGNRCPFIRAFLERHAEYGELFVPPR